MGGRKVWGCPRGHPKRSYRNMKKILALVCSLFLLVSGVAVYAGCSVDDDTIVVGVTNYPPMDYPDESGEWIGFDAELAEKAFGELGYEVEFKEIVWETKIVSLNSGEIDVIWNGMTVTEELQEAILLSEPYMVNQQVLVIRTEDADKYTSQADLAEAGTIAFEGGSAADNILSEMEGISEDQLLSMDKQADTFLEVKSGSSDVAVVDIALAKDMAGQGDFTDLMYVDVGFASEDFAVGFRKEDTELCAQIDELLAKYKEDGTIDELGEKYGVAV